MCEYTVSEEEKTGNNYAQYCASPENVAAAALSPNMEV